MMGTKVHNMLGYSLIVLVASVLVFSIVRMLPLGQDHDKPEGPSTRSELTAFDQQYARSQMDRNGDGRCDVCGMPVEQCISAGMLQCTMDPAATIGLLESAHAHAGLEVSVGGERLDLGDQKYFVKSAFIHVEAERDPAMTGRILHIHATGVPLRLFFESIGLALDNPELSVNGNREDFATYSPEDGDEIVVHA